MKDGLRILLAIVVATVMISAAEQVFPIKQRSHEQVVLQFTSEEGSVKSHIYAYYSGGYRVVGITSYWNSSRYTDEIIVVMER